MKKVSKKLFICLGAFLILFISMAKLRLTDPPSFRSPNSWMDNSSKKEDKNAWQSENNNDNDSQDSNSSQDFLIQRNFMDFKRNEISVQYKIKRSDYQKSMNEFGMFKRQCSIKAKSKLEELVDDFKSRKNLQLQVNFFLSDLGDLRWRYRYKARSQREKDLILRGINNISHYYLRFRDYCYSKGGFIRKKGSPNIYTVNYRWLQQKNMHRIKTVFDALYKKAVSLKYNEKNFLSMLLAFCQEIPYRIPPLKIGNKIISGMLPPTQTVVENWGDCDCKATLFASLWAHYKKNNMVLVWVPGHIFSAVKGRRVFATDIAININGETYICMEPVGPGKLPIGKVSRLSMQHLNAKNYRIFFMN